MPLPLVRALLMLLALALPARAGDGARSAADAREATQTLRTYIQSVTARGERPDPTRPEIAALLGRIFDLDALNALPPAEADDIPWLLDWMEAANGANKLLMFNGSRPGPQPDLAAIERNMLAYEDQYAAMMNFLIRCQAREAISIRMFMAGLAPEQRTRIREEGFTGARHATAELILGVVCSVIMSGGKPANARLVAAAIRDTREVWASFFLPQDRARVLAQLADLPARVPDETARDDIGTFTAALAAVN
ncbi:hypothetical protein JQ557_13370 [Bradyrhizobium sp. U87765 SZCCT0131]|uniref:hypothetical protein n=1 Tax=unclassified Bradyrhizobium TaxID=2631580 RepID=UPI001BADA76B|nr:MULTISPECIES: hypothetical protein [unclassified Bradyrhizobium]MBR1218988.1 hypothetical protein [Bradyrhizobium sp. U87765 SZCCT0131]MBR1261639.1 hypothetical protein [Bradyrhizobium sp. U87765 SZCCT0134]MBR1306508.1 hypothetical protein [Bradyrhizobium sp. U87765 SZCCT0110]MBR1317421.1 hypothetical protein [Bradyrhizobium sp. U87765 SZCCT0109]MBR1351123.1 hypothetical protein [Bradyrhizobium sp. U87765 SZCCT0048]